MKDAAGLERMALEQDQRIAEVLTREQARLRNFIRRRVPDPRDAEDILQDVFYELVEANRLLMPIEHVTGWLFRVARNRITDLFRKKRPERFSDTGVADEDEERLRLEDLLPSPDAGPEVLYARNVLLDELELAVDELPEEQREVFVAHELEGPQLQGDGCRDRREREHAALAEALCGAASARAAAGHLRRIYESMRNRTMRRRWIFLAPLMVLAVLLFVAVGGAVVQQLWNWLLPSIFGWRQITFWQALGILALCRILFGGFGHGGTHRSGFRRRMAERWEHMSPEERERLRRGMRGRSASTHLRARVSVFGFGAPLPVHPCPTTQPGVSHIWSPSIRST